MAHRVAILRRGRLAVVDSLENLHAIAVRRLDIEFAERVPRADELQALPGVQKARLNGSHAVVTFEGSADPLVKAIARYEVRSLQSRAEDLEEIFLRYYRGPEGE